VLSAEHTEQGTGGAGAGGRSAGLPPAVTRAGEPQDESALPLGPAGPIAGAASYHLR
jgi:hypothetical protein